MNPRSQSSARQRRRSGRAKGTKHTAKFARALGQDPLWLETGEGRMREAARARRQVRNEFAESLPELANYERLPVFDLKTATGRDPLGDAAQVASYAVFRSAWLRNLTATPFSQLAIVQMSGDAMEPTLNHGDQALVDTTQTNLRREGLYVLRLDDTAMIRRVTMHPATRRVTIGSDNARYKPYEDLDPGGLDVLGRLIWIGRTLG